ncbi:hypothetical protein AB0M46_21545 [Dactylosporangium sp. NPDC051485]|uniref:hypothetical protein n=1 Tax=Dactylosporangium sp. NPDC051485 TaxID=3154846 RepID=UPI003435D1B2
MTGSRRADRTRQLSMLCLAALLLPTPAGSAPGVGVTLPGAAVDQPYSEVHLLRWTVSSTRGGGDSVRQIVDSWRWRHDLDGSGLLRQGSPAAASAVFPPGALPLWSGTVAVPGDPDGLRRLLTRDIDTAPGSPDTTVLARIADLSSVYCPTPAQRAAIVGLINDRIGPPTTSTGPTDTYTATVAGTRWTLTVEHATNVLLGVDTVEVSTDGATQAQHTDYLSCRHTHAPHSTANGDAA